MVLDTFPSTTSNHKQMMIFTYNFETFGSSHPYKIYLLSS